MILFLRAQDIGSFEAAVDDRGRVISGSLSVPPERLLVSLRGLLEEWGVDGKSLERVVVVTGPGSFTSTRMIVTIANAIAFAENIPVLGLPNSERLSLVELIREGRWQTIKADSPFASPLYDRPPNITVRKN